MNYVLQRRLWIALRVIITASIFAYLFFEMDWQKITSLLPKLFLWQVAVAFALPFLSLGCMTFRWNFLLQHFKLSTTLPELYGFYIVSCFYGLILPGVLGIDAVRLSLSMKRFPESKGTVLATIFFERGCGLLAFLLSASCSAVLLPEIITGLQRFSCSIYGVTVAGFCLFAAFFVIIKVSPDRWYCSEPSPGLRGTIHFLAYQFRTFSLSVSANMVLFSLCAQMIEIIGAWLLSQALGLPLPFLFYLLVMPIVFVATTLPISLNGLGVREGLLAFFMVAAGGTLSDAVLLGFLIYLAKFNLGLVGGLVNLICFRRSLAT